jgi:hypothetical protein
MAKALTIAIALILASAWLGSLIGDLHAFYVSDSEGGEK